MSLSGGFVSRIFLRHIRLLKKFSRQATGPNETIELQDSFESFVVQSIIPFFFSLPRARVIPQLRNPENPAVSTGVQTLSLVIVPSLHHIALQRIFASSKNLRMSIGRPLLLNALAVFVQDVRRASLRILAALCKLSMRAIFRPLPSLLSSLFSPPLPYSPPFLSHLPDPTPAVLCPPSLILLPLPGLPTLPCVFLPLSSSPLL
jgi:hypothetical protein